MKWFSKKEPSLKDLVVKSPLREFLFDSQVEPIATYMNAVGLPPMSDEVIEMERRHSDTRVHRIAPLMPLIHGYAHAFADAAIGARKSVLEGEDAELPEAFFDEGARMFEAVSMSTITGVLSQLVEMGVVEVHLEDQ